MLSVTDRKSLVATIDTFAQYDASIGSIIYPLQRLREQRSEVTWKVMYAAAKSSRHQSGTADEPSGVVAEAVVQLGVDQRMRENHAEASGRDEGAAIANAVLEALRPLLQLELGETIVVEDPEPRSPYSY